MIVVAGRKLGSKVDGITRYANEIVQRFPKDSYAIVAPRKPLAGITGTLWDHVVLPRRCRGASVLWSPDLIAPNTSCPFVVTIHGAAPLLFPEGFSAKFRKLFKLKFDRAVTKASKILTVSEFSKRRFIEHLGVPSNLVEVIPLGIPEACRPCSETEIDTARKRYGLPEDYLLFLGTLEPRKNLSRLMQAWSQGKESGLFPSAKLVVAGGLGASSVFARDSPRVKVEDLVFPGRIAEQDLPAVYAGCRGFVYPSLDEGFGLPPLEAAATGAPILTSINSPMADHFGSQAILVDPWNVDDLSRGLARLWNDPVSPPNSVALHDKFNWNRTAQATYKILSEVGNLT